MTVIRVLADRTAVLFLGVGVGLAIGYAFAGDIAKRIAPAPVATPTTATPVGPDTQFAPSQPTSLSDHADRQATQPIESHTSAPAAFERGTQFSDHLLQTLKQGGKIQVGVFGDSFGDGVWAALYHQLKSKDGYEVHKFSQQATGFTRYRQLNLEDRVASDLANKPIDIAVISFGANDTQPVMHNGHFAALLSQPWKDEISEKVERYIGLLRRHGAVVYWVGLPKMRKDSFDTDISGMNAFYAALMSRLGVPFIDTKPMSVDASGAYAAYLPDSVTHETRLMRANDGIHMSMHGYEVLTAGLAQRIRAFVALASDAQKNGRAISLASAQSVAVAPPPAPPATAPQDTKPKAKAKSDQDRKPAAPLIAPAPPKTKPESLDDIAAAIDEAKASNDAAPTDTKADNPKKKKKDRAKDKPAESKD